MQESDKIIYLDNAATTRCDNDVAQRVFEVLTEEYGNPSSLHGMGLRAERLIDEARRRVAAALSCGPEEIYFTGGATEANNLAVQGGARAKARRGEKIAVSSTEHHSVLLPARQLEKEGFLCSEVPPSGGGSPTAGGFAGVIDGRTVLAACMLVNSETGAIADIAAISREAHKINPQLLFHCDAVQALGRLPINARALGVDTLSISAHKAYGPKGVGALYIKRSTRLLPLMFGGQQQSALRPGTENVAGIAALGLVCENAVKQIPERESRARELVALLAERTAGVVGLSVNSPKDGSPYICNLSVLGVRSETMLHFLERRGIFVSSGSACSRGDRSHVLAALGLPPGVIDSAIRISLAKYTTEQDIAAAAAAICEGAKTLARAN